MAGVLLESDREALLASVKVWTIGALVSDASDGGLAQVTYCAVLHGTWSRRLGGRRRGFRSNRGFGATAVLDMAI